MVVIAASGVAAWLVAVDLWRLAGAFVLAAAVANGLAAAGADDATPRAVFLEEVGDRIMDAAVLGALAWVAFADEPRVTAAAAVLLVAASVTAYLRARGRALGYAIGELAVYRGVRVAIVALGLLLGVTEAALWLALALVLVAGSKRWLAAAREDQKLVMRLRLRRS